MCDILPHDKNIKTCQGLTQSKSAKQQTEADQTMASKCTLTRDTTNTPPKMSFFVQSNSQIISSKILLFVQISSSY